MEVQEEAVPVRDRRLLMNMAYRMLGSVAEAEDAVQEAYARWYAMSDQGRDEVRSPTAWLVTVLSRICIDVLGSARRRRVRYVGEWLPEPVSPSAAWTSLAVDRRSGDPAELVALDESLDVALLVVLETMTPAERVVFVLHEVFGHRFAEIGGIVGRSPGACRQLASSARRRLRQGRRQRIGREEHARTVAAFKEAWQTGDAAALVAALDPAAAAVVDGGGRVSAPAAPVRGAAAVAAVFLDVHRKVPGLVVEAAAVGARPGLVARGGDGRVVAAIAADGDGERIGRLWVMRDPAKLTTWR
ncbi:MAG TPA: sigma-70 family RNA polymerase sigma factor [Glycomyces sp.]|nr:sigma-70 family RNA polymerase sigma factor [Glycomyces sp.]